MDWLYIFFFNKLKLKKLNWNYKKNSLLIFPFYLKNKQGKKNIIICILKILSITFLEIAHKRVLFLYI
jgi:hypothetical protein